MPRVSSAPAGEAGPNRLFDLLIQELGAQNDVGLAALLGVTPPAISKVRNGHNAFSAELLLAAHEASGISIRELRTILGDTENRYWPICAHERILDKTAGKPSADMSKPAVRPAVRRRRTVEYYLSAMR